MSKTLIAENLENLIDKQYLLEHDDEFIKIDAVHYIEELQEVNTAFCKFFETDTPPHISSTDALKCWGGDMADRLNDGELSVEALCSRFFVKKSGSNKLKFAKIDAYEVEIEREDLNHPWTFVVHTNNNRKTKSP